MQVAICFGSPAPSWTSEMRMPELAACQSAQVQAVLTRQAWALRLRRLTPLPILILQGLRGRAPARSAWRRAHRGRGVPRPPSRHRRTGRRCARKRCHPVVHGLVPLAQVRDCARCPFGRRLAPPCFVHDHVVEGAVDDCGGQAWCSLAPGWSS